MYCPAVLEARTIRDEVVGRVGSFGELRGKAVPCRWWFAGSLWHSVACSSLTSPVLGVFPVFVLVSTFPLSRTTVSDIGFGLPLLLPN